MKDGLRHEYKFLISRGHAELLKLRLPHLMQRDANVGQNGTYTIRSLYFDDMDHSAYEEKVSGIEDRTKYRIRLYNYDDRVIKLEKKEKRGDLTRKTAQRITKQQADALQRRITDSCLHQAEGLIQELQMNCLQNGVRPKVLVDYDRTPFICRDGNTRITLDENLRTRPYNAKLDASSQAMIPVLAPDQVILEVKFDDFLPGYLVDALRDIPKDRIAISKFALCMEFI